MVTQFIVLGVLLISFGFLLAYWQLNKLFIAAATTQNKALFDFALHFGFDVDDAVPVENSHSTPLMLAISARNDDFSRYLLARGAQPNGYDSEGYVQHGMQFLDMTPLALAVSLHSVEIASSLIEFSADINLQSRSSDGWHLAPLFLASYYQDVPMASMLIAKGADVNSLNQISELWNVTPLYIAASLGDEGMVNLLIQNGANVNARIKNNKLEYSSALQIALKNGHVSIATELIKAGADINACIQHAVKAGNEQLAFELIAAGADVNIALLAAAEKSNNFLFSLMLEKPGLMQSLLTSLRHYYFVV